jgi:lipopolysaccharide/colanic/teichoic acid biosynthesis glycosyltransferase
MNKSTILMTTTKVFLIQDLSSPDQTNVDNKTNLCSLRWKCGILWVNREHNHDNHLAALENLQWVKKCLKHSFAHLVCIDSSLGEAEVDFWADSCKQVKKPIFVRISSHSRRLKVYRPFSRIFKILSDRIVSAFLLLLLSPFILIVIVLMNLASQGSIFSQEWRVGKRGRLFQIIQLRSMSQDIQMQYRSVSGTQRSLSKNGHNTNIALLGLWMRKYALDKIPQLMNVLRGEMSIVGPRALTLHDAIETNSKYRPIFCVLPGILSPCHLESYSSLTDIDRANYFEFEYLRNWSLWKDIQILLGLYRNHPFCR